MIENFNDLLSAGLIVTILCWSAYLFIKSIARSRLEKHIRDEQRYYKEWDEN